MSVVMVNVFMLNAVAPAR